MNAAAATAVTRAAAGVTEQYLTFVLAGEVYAIPILSVQEIRGWERVSQVPRAPRHVLGVTNLRGTMVPVIDVRARLALEPQAMTQTTVVIVVRIEYGSSVATVGCVVDAVSDVVDIAVDGVQPAPDACGSVESHFLTGMSTIDDRLVMLLDLSRLIDGGALSVGRSDASEAAPAAASLFERLGGAAAVDAAVDVFYSKVMADASLAPFFASTDLKRQKAMQRAFLTMAFGGPSRYDGRNLREAHAGAVQRGLRDAHFDAVVAHLGATLAELGVADSLIQEAAAVAGSVRSEVLGK